MDKLFIYTDGASRGNPGPSAVAFLIFSDQKLLFSHKENIGKSTNNVAEYTALIKALEKASGLSRGEVACFSDSQLMVSQLNGSYKVRKPHLKPLFEKVKALEKGFEKVAYKHLNRTDPTISKADSMVNEALDKDQ